MRNLNFLNTSIKYKNSIFILIAIVIIVNIPIILKDNGYSNAYSLLAQSLIKGKIALPEIKGYPYMDMIEYEGKHYLPYPPLPAMLLIPPILVFGPGHADASIIAILLTCLNILILSNLLKHFSTNSNITMWLIVGFIFASPYWFVLITSNYHYGFAQIVATTFSLLFLNEIMSKRRWALVGLYLGAAFLCRQGTIFFGSLVLIMLFHQFKQNKKVPWLSIGYVAITLGVSLVIFFIYNYLRFSNAFTTGYEYIAYIGPLAQRVKEYGVFSLHYVPYNFYYTFIKGHDIIFNGKDLLQIQGMDLFGTSLTVASPFIFIAVKAETKPYLKYGFWAVIVPILALHLLYHNNGFHQVNTSRFALDYFPALIILIASGSKYCSPLLIKMLISYSIVLNILSFVIYQTHH